jgi:hypothetical protein
MLIQEDTQLSEKPENSLAVTRWVARSRRYVGTDKSLAAFGLSSIVTI